MTKRPKGLEHALVQTFGSSIGFFFLTFGTGIVLARMLGPEDRGTYGAIQFWVQVVVGFGASAFYDAAVVRIREMGYERARALPFLLLIGVLLGGVTIALITTAILWEWLVFDGISPGGAAAFAAIAVSLAYLLRALSASDTANLQFDFVNMERLFSPLLFLIGAALLWIGGLGLGWLLIVFLISKVPTLLFKFTRLRKFAIGPIDRPLAGATCRLAPRFAASSGAFFVASQADRIIVTTSWSPGLMGQYFIAFTACGASLAFISQAMNLTLLPSLAGLSTEERQRKVGLLIRLAVLLGPLSVVPIALLAPVLIPLVYGADYGPAVQLAMWLALALSLRPTLTVINNANRSAGNWIAGLEMAVAATLVWIAAWLLLDLAQVPQFFGTFAAANLVSALAGIRHLKRDGAIVSLRHLVPGFSEVALLWATVAKLLRKAKRSAS